MKILTLIIFYGLSGTLSYAQTANERFRAHQERLLQERINKKDGCKEIRMLATRQKCIMGKWHKMTKAAASVVAAQRGEKGGNQNSCTEVFKNQTDQINTCRQKANEMKEDLYKRISVAETFSSDLAHEIRNPLTSLKGASEVLENTSDDNKRKKLIKVISHDVERIERLITDYSQMLKDEATLSREKMKKIDFSNVINSVVEDFNSDLINSNKNIKININHSNLNGSRSYVLGVESKLEQIVANLLDNAVSFSPENGKITVICAEKKRGIQLVIEDQGPGFNEKNIDKIFDRFYSNRPENFGEHSGLGLNIVKNIIELHGGSIMASNLKSNKKGARIEVLLPFYK